MNIKYEYKTDFMIQFVVIEICVIINMNFNLTFKLNI